MNKKLTMFAFVATLGVFLLGIFNVPVIATTDTTTETSALPSEIKLCGVFPISQRPDAGPDRRDGFLMAIDQINAQTGSNRILPAGVNLTGIVKDDLNTAAGGTAAAQACISDGADLVIGSSGSTVSAAMAAVLTPNKIIQISYASSSPALSDRSKYPYFMRNVASDADQGVAIANLVAAFGWTKGATINTDDSYGTGLVSVFKSNYNQTSGNKLVTEQTFAPGASDVSAQVQAISDAKPQFVLLHAIDVDAKTVFKKAYDLGIAGSSSNIAWIITDGSSSTATFEGDTNVQAAMQHVIGTTPTPLSGDSASKYTAFNNSWWSVKSCGSQDPCGAARTNANPNSYAPFAYDAVYVAAKGIAAAQTVSHSDTDTLLKALYNVSFTGASGVIKFNSKGEINGRFDYVTLLDSTYHTFGTWELGSLPNFIDTSVVLPGGQTLVQGYRGTTGTSVSTSPGFEYLALLLGIGTLVIIRKKK